MAAQATAFMKRSSPNLKIFADSLLTLSQDALRFSRDYVGRSPKEPKNPELKLFFEQALKVVQDLQAQLHRKTAARSKAKKLRRKS